MTDEIISLRVDKRLKERMRMHDEVNWSAVLRKAIIKKLEEDHKIDYEKVKKVSEKIDRLRESGAFSLGTKTGTEIIRGWRNKKRF